MRSVKQISKFSYIISLIYIVKPFIINNMKNEAYNSVAEYILIEKFNSYSSPCEESNAILTYLWEKNLAFITGQCRQYFSTSSFINYEDILQECFITFLGVIRTYDPRRGQLTTALLRPLQHTFINYVAGTYNLSQHSNLMVAHYKTILKENGLTGNEDINHLTFLYNQRYPRNPITAKSLQKYRNYCLMQEMVQMDQNFNADLISATRQPQDPIWHDFDVHSMYVLIRDYIEQKAEEDSRPLLLFLFGFVPSVEIEGHLYSVNEKPHPIGPLRKASFKLFPELIKYLYDNDCIPDADTKSLFHFLCCIHEAQSVF